MPTVFSESMNLGDLLKYEAPNLYSRDRVTVVAGQTLPLGAVVGMVTATGIGAKHSKIKLRARPRDTNFAPGTVLLREWGDREHKVAVTAEGLFEYEGSTFKSLTAVARQITGTHWSGPLFFGLTGKAGAQ